MGFHATRHGAAGEKDVLVISPTGTSQVTFTVEGKGSKSKVANDSAEVAGAAAHRKDAGAEHALIVARDFAGFERAGDEAAILKECREVGRVSVVTVQTLIELAKAVHRFYYPLEMILPALASVETPDDKQARIGQLASPVQDLDYRALLDTIWAKQQQEAAGDVVSFRPIWQEKWRGVLPTFEDFKLKLVALEALATGLMRLNITANEITLLQSPSIIAQKIQESLTE